MELRSVEELMDLLYACRGEQPAGEYGGGPGDPHGHALRTAALLRRRRPADKELQVAGLVALCLLYTCPGDWAHDDDLSTLRQAQEEARTAVFDAGVLEDWRTVLELTAARNSRLGAVD